SRSAAYLFPPRPTVRMDVEKPAEEDQLPRHVGQNVPAGVVVSYWLKDKPAEKDKVTLEFLDGDTVIRTLSSEKPPKAEDLAEQAKRDEEQKEKDKPLEPKAGVNRFVWDMRILKPTLAPKTVFNEGTKAPPKVAPGTYKVRLTAGGQVYTETVEVRPHPGGFATAQDLKAQYDLLKSIRDRLSETHDAVLKIRDLRQQAKDLGDRAERLGKGDALKRRATALADKLTVVEEKLTNPQIKSDEDDLNYEPKLDHDWSYLAGLVSEGDGKPTAASRRYYEALKAQLDAIHAELQALMDGDVKEFNEAVAQTGIPPVVAAPRSGS